MGSPIQIYRLFKYSNTAGAGCQHFLLLQLNRAGFSNSSETEYEQAESLVDRRAREMLIMFETGVLRTNCTRQHEIAVRGEMQEAPFGDALFDRHASRWLDIWVAETNFGHPWVVIGTASTEDDFWSQMKEESNDDLRSLEPRAPAQKFRVWFMSDAEL